MQKPLIQSLYLLLAFTGGLIFAFVDSRPTWDDTALLAFGILLFSALMAFLARKRAWLVALLVGVWIPLYGIFISHNAGSLIALAFAFVGAYAGWGVSHLLSVTA